MTEELEGLVLDAVKERGCRLYHAELKGNRLEVYVEKQGGATVGDCEKISKALALTLSLVREEWRNLMLDVSTPGIERKLYAPEHYASAVGQRLEIKTRSGIIEGILKEALDDCIVIEENNGVGRRLSYNEILSAQVKLSTEELFKRRK